MKPDEFTITLRSLPGWSTPAIVRLRAALKHLLRACGFRVVTLAESGQQTAETAQTQNECLTECGKQSES